MIETKYICDKCGKGAIFVGGAERYNNNIIGFHLPDDWFFTGDILYCPSCIAQLIKKDKEKSE